MTDQELEDLKKRIEIIEKLLFPKGGGGPTVIEEAFDHLEKKIDDLEGRTVTKKDLEELQDDLDRTKRVALFAIRESNAKGETEDGVEEMLRERFGEKITRTKYMEGD